MEGREIEGKSGRKRSRKRSRRGRGVEVRKRKVEREEKITVNGHQSAFQTVLYMGICLKGNDTLYPTKHDMVV